MAKVRFGGFSEGGWDEDRSAVVYMDGEEVGEIIRQVEDIGATGREWVVSGYEVILWGSPSFTRLFEVRRIRRGSFIRSNVPTGEYADARTALAAAKAAVREVLR